MTTFQYIIDSILHLFSGVIPLSYSWAAQLEEHFLHFSSTPEVEYLVTMILSVAFLAYFRFDWLGLLSAFTRTIIKPSSIKTENRTLDQEVVIFLTVVTVPSLILRHWLAPLIADIEILNSLIAYGVFFLIGFGLLRFAYRWNRRIRGLNHLRTIDVVPVILISILSAHPAFPYALVLWVGMSLANYHYDAIFKYSMLLIAIRNFCHLFNMMGSMSIQSALQSIGHLNSIAIIVVCFAFVWAIIDNLQKSMSENTFRSFQWLSAIAAISSFGLHFLKG